MAQRAAGGVPVTAHVLSSLRYNINAHEFNSHSDAFTQVKEEAVMPAWRGELLAAFQAACDACCTIGTKTDHYFPAPQECDTCIFFAKKVQQAVLNLGF